MSNSIEEKTKLFVDLVYEKSNAEQLAWTQSFSDNCFETKFGNVTIKIRNVYFEEDESSEIIISIENLIGDTIDRIDADMLRAQFPATKKHSTYSKLLRDLYSMVQRQALGADKVLGDLIEELRKLN